MLMSMTFTALWIALPTVLCMLADQLNAPESDVKSDFYILLERKPNWTH